MAQLTTEFHVHGRRAGGSGGARDGPRHPLTLAHARVRRLRVLAYSQLSARTPGGVDEL